MTDCSRCGICCEDISIGMSPDYIQEKLLEIGYTPTDPTSGWYNHVFILDNWIYNGPDDKNGHKYQCAQFDSETRTCMAHESRPNVCRDYPWYGRDPSELRKYEAGKFLDPQCSFNADVRTMLPIVQVS